MLGDRSYLDGNFSVFGDTVEGLDVVMRIAKGDIVETVRIVRVGAKAEAFHPTTESFRAMVKAAEQRVAEHKEKKRIAEREWIARNYPKASGEPDGVLTETLASGQSDAVPAEDGFLHVRYQGREVRYVGDVLGREGPPLDATSFGSGDNGVPGFVDPPRTFTLEPGKKKVNPGLDGVISEMHPGERRIVIVPASLAYARAGLYPPAPTGTRRFVISPDTMLVYDVEVLAKQ